MQLHDLAERRDVARLGARVRLHQRVYVLLHQADAHQLVAFPADDRPALRVPDEERSVCHAGVCLTRNANPAKLDGQITIAQSIEDLIAALRRDAFDKLIDVVHAARGVHPAGRRIEPLIDEELSPRHSAVRVQPLLAHHLELGPEVERRVRIDPQQGVMIGRQARRDRDAVGSRGIQVELLVGRSCGVT